MNNVYGSGPATAASFTATVDGGLRTLSGGQLSMQVEGYLAIQTDAAPPLVIEATEAMRDIFAVVGEAPSGGADPIATAPGQHGLLHVDHRRRHDDFGQRQRIRPTAAGRRVRW